MGCNYSNFDLKVSNDVKFNNPNLSQFKILKVIGSGQSSNVFLVQYKLNNKLYAMKTIKRKDIDSEAKVKYLFNEFMILKSINSNFLSKFYDFFMTKNHFIFILEYIEGGDFFYYVIYKKRFTEKEACFYLSQIILGLEYLHDKNIIYRDLKLENILITKDGYLKLSDFGISKFGKKANTMIGTIKYIAPEIFEKKNYNNMIDFWCLGVISFRLLNGYFPFKNNNDLTSINNFKYIYNNNLTKNANNFIKNLLIVNPEKRLGVKGFDSIKKHPFLNNIKWDKIINKKVKPIYYPTIKDLKNCRFFEEKKSITENIFLDLYEDELDFTNKCSILKEIDN